MSEPREMKDGESCKDCIWDEYAGENDPCSDCSTKYPFDCACQFEPKEYACGNEGRDVFSGPKETCKSYDGGMCESKEHCDYKEEVISNKTKEEDMNGVVIHDSFGSFKVGGEYRSVWRIKRPLWKRVLAFWKPRFDRYTKIQTITSVDRKARRLGVTPDINALEPVIEYGVD